MAEENIRTVGLIGEQAFEKLKKSKVIIFGIGGVGSYAAEAVARAGVGNITLVDNDTVSLSNINRQLIALHSTLGRPKVDVMRERILDIAPNANIEAMPLFFDENTAERFDFSAYDYVLDCIDSVPSKVLLVKCATEANTKIISAMGTGNKLHPEMFELADIAETSYCPLARTVRQRLKKEGIEHLDVVYSKESPVCRDAVPASISFVPSAAGLLMASKVIRELI